MLTSTGNQKEPSRHLRSCCGPAY
ncbi:hypothetical protein LINGRAHAP2_LOCUS14382 [Linum grandiflorum]